MKKRLKNYRKTVGNPLNNYLITQMTNNWKLLQNYWTTLEKLLRKYWKTNAKILKNYWINMENYWKLFKNYQTIEKLLQDYWKKTVDGNCLKMIEKLLNIALAPLSCFVFSTTIETVERIFQLFIEKYVFNNFSTIFQQFFKSFSTVFH